MKQACVIGWPIAHSRSPLIHSFWLRQHGIEGTYTRVPVEPGCAGRFVKNIATNGYVGCNVTIPHKEEVFAAVNAGDEDTRRLQAVNTVYVQDSRVWGISTDGQAFLTNLLTEVPSFRLSDQRIVVLGAGGTARSVAFALEKHRIGEIAIYNRNRERASALAREIGSCARSYDWRSAEDGLGECSLLVNTTSLGMTGQPSLDLSLDNLQGDAVVADVIYTPLETPLVLQARKLGHHAFGGLGMLLHQAVPGFELWFGVRPAITPELVDLVSGDIRSKTVS